MSQDSTPLHSPTPRELINLDRPVDIRVSPGGTRAAILVQRTNWQENARKSVMNCRSSGFPKQWIMT